QNIHQQKIVNQPQNLPNSFVINPTFVNNSNINNELPLNFPSSSQQQGELFIQISILRFLQNWV
ncbi:hypothetical protein Mgra_00008088, partial [Meloidogyne graminicola]